MPFALFSKSDRIGRPADFLSTQQSSHDGRRDRYGASYGGASTTALAFNKQGTPTTFRPCRVVMRMFLPSLQ